MEVLTALGNNNLFKKLKTINGIKLYKNDIQYREGIIEVLKENDNINLIIIYEKILGSIEFEELINKIKIINNEIKFIFILENKNEKLENILLNNNIKNIFYNNEINFNEFILKIKNINFSEKDILKKENEKFKKIIFEKNEEINKYKKNENNLIKNNKEKILIITNLKFNEFKKIKNKLIKLNEKLNLEYLFLNNINKKIKYYENILFLINENILEIKKTKNKIKIINLKYYINNKKIKIIFLENKNNSINLKILKNIFKENSVLGKIKIKKNNYLIDKKIIKKFINGG